MTTFVLVHGAWHGGWCWRDVAKGIRAAGHDVFTPTLTGLGDRVHLQSPEIGLSVHIQDIVNLLKAEELTDVVLCGHSYGGMVISGVASAASKHLAALVYLEAFLPSNGDCTFDVMAPETRGVFEKMAQNGGNGWLVAPLNAKFFGVNDLDQQNWVDRRCEGMAIRAFQEVLQNHSEPKSEFRRHYILANGNNPSQFHAIHDRLSSRSDWNTHRLECGHDAMVIDPDGVSKILLSA